MSESIWNHSRRVCEASGFQFKRKKKKKHNDRFASKSPWDWALNLLHVTCLHLYNDKWKSFTWLSEQPSLNGVLKAAIMRSPLESWCLSPVQIHYTHSRSRAHILLQDANALWAKQTGCCRGIGGVERLKLGMMSQRHDSADVLFFFFFPNADGKYSLTAAADKLKDTLKHEIVNCQSDCM